MALTLFLNIVLLFTIKSNRILQTLDNAFIVNLSVCDLMNGLAGIGNLILWNMPSLNKEMFRDLCLGVMILVNYVVMSEFAALFIFTVDRFLKITYPFKHDIICTNLRFIFLIVFIHSVSALATFCFSLTFEWDVTKECNYFNVFPQSVVIFVNTCIFISLSSMLVMNMKILFTSKRQARQINVQLVSVRPTGNSNPEPEVKSVHVGKILGVLSLFTFVAFVPYWVYLGIQLAGVKLSDYTQILLHNMGLYLWLMGPILNPLAFMMGKSDINACARQMLLKNCTRTRT